MMDQEKMQEEPPTETPLQKKVMAYGQQGITAGCALAVISGILCIGAGGYYVYYLTSNEDTGKGTLLVWKIVTIICLALTPYGILVNFFGKYLKKAGETRDVRTLKILFGIWSSQDLIFLALSFVCVFVFSVHPFYLFIMIVCVGVDVYGLVIVWKFIKECTTNYTQSIN